MIRRSYDAILLDLDGTLVDDTGRVVPETGEALRAIAERGVRVMVATGRSELGAAPAIVDLGVPEPAVVYNGAAIWCPRRDVLLEEQVLSNRTVARTLELAREGGYLPVVMRAGEKLSAPPRNVDEVHAVEFLEGLRVLDGESLPTENLIRITLFSGAHASSEDFGSVFKGGLGQPVFLTHFPLACLVQHRGSPLQVVDIQPPCRGKAEAVRYLGEVEDIPPERIVAVGDATNDLEMFADAGLAVAMANAVPEARAAADRVIGDNNGPAIAELVRELFQ